MGSEPSVVKRISAPGVAEEMVMVWEAEKKPPVTGVTRSAATKSGVRQRSAAVSWVLGSPGEAASKKPVVAGSEGERPNECHGSVRGKSRRSTMEAPLERTRDSPPAESSKLVWILARPLRLARSSQRTTRKPLGGMEVP